MITSSYPTTATERILPRMFLDFTTAITDARVATVRAGNTATRINANGAIELVNANLPRYDFSPTTLNCLGQLIEETRINLFLNSLIDGTNLATQSVTLSAVSYTLSFYGAGSITISGGHSATVTGTGAYPSRKTYTFTPTAGSTTFTVSGTVQYAQIEAGAFATSFIPTASTSVTRNADVVTMTGANFSDWYNQPEGTFVVTFTPDLFLTNNTNRVIQVSQGGGSNRVVDIYPSGTNWANYNGTTASVIGAASVTSTPQKISVAYKTLAYGYAINGGGVTAAASALVNTPNRLEIGHTAGVNLLNGHMQKIQYYKQRLINGEISAFCK